MTMPAIISTARTLSYYSQLQEVTANNLANASTDAFKADRLVSHQLTDGGDPVAVPSLDLSQGLLRDTQRPLDVALDGPGFLVVRTAQGERLMRGASLEVGESGLLVDRHGDAILGREGPIHVAGRKVTIDPEGTVFVDGVKADVLRLEDVEHQATLRKEGNGRYLATAGTVAASGVTVKQGQLEEANVNALQGSVNLLMVQRAYAASVDALRAMDNVLSIAAGDIGRV